ncbi:MAG: formate/nitrite transporter family protein [Succinivibrio sp.]|nr:formate/nitrite transporter family protein [Succinivibrio sp.]
MNTLRSAILAGLCIGLGGIVNLKTGGVVGAILFSFGLLTVVHYRYKLFTGTAGFTETRQQFIDLIIILLGNILGCLMLAYTIDLALPDLYQPASDILFNRLKLSPLQGFILAIFCGFVMTASVRHARENRFLPLLFGVPLFILCGFLHSIADAFYYALALLHHDLSVELVILYSCIVAGNFVGCNLYRLVRDKA